MYSDNITQKVAEAARKIMSGQTVTEKLHPNQQKLDVHEPEKDELTSDDFKKLRAGKKADVKKEEVEELDEISTKTLAGAAKAASDPDSDYYYGKSHDAQKFADHAKKTKDAKSAAAVQGAADAKGHYPRDNHTSGYDKLAYRTPPRVTAAGKANKQDIKALKTKLKEEEMEQVEEGIEDRLEAARAKAKAAGKPIKNKPAAPKSNVRKIEGSAYGGAKQKDEPEADEDDTPAKKTVKYGARQNYTRSKRVNESFTQMVSDYKTEGLKFISESLIVEEPTEEEFNAEIEKAKAKSQGKDKAQVAKASVQAVKNEAVEQEIQVINADAANGVEQIDIEERSMSDAEMNKREKIVKSMKKGLSGFKERYGDKAKNVMYATATKQAMKD